MRRVGSHFPAPLTPTPGLKGRKLPKASQKTQIPPGSTIVYRGMDREDIKRLINLETGE